MFRLINIGKIKESFRSTYVYWQNFKWAHCGGREARSHLAQRHTTQQRESTENHHQRSGKKRRA